MTTMTFPACKHPAWGQVTNLVARQGVYPNTLDVDADLLNIIPTYVPWLWVQVDDSTELMFGEEHLAVSYGDWWTWDGEKFERNQDPLAFLRWCYSEMEYYQVIRSLRSLRWGRMTNEIQTTWERHPCDALAILRGQQDVQCLRVLRDFDLLFDRGLGE